MTDLLKQNLKIINLGIINFYKDYKKQDIDVVQVDWRPPGTGDTELDKILKDII